MFSRLLAVAAVVFGFALPTQAAPIVFNAANDFSATSNPNGPWSYGMSPTLNGTFTQLSATNSYVNGGTLNAWQAASGSVFTNPTTTLPGVFSADGAFTQGSVSLPAGALAQHPGSAGQYSVVRFTAPFDGTYDLTSAFSSGDTTGATTDVYVLLNGSPVFNGTVNGAVGSGPFAQVFQLAAGDRLDFAVGLGNNGTFNNDTTILSANIVATPEPATLGVLGALGLAGAGYVRRRKAAVAA